MSLLFCLGLKWQGDNPYFLSHYVLDYKHNTIDARLILFAIAAVAVLALGPLSCVVIPNWLA